MLGVGHYLCLTPLLFALLIGCNNATANSSSKGISDTSLTPGTSTTPAVSPVSVVTPSLVKRPVFDKAKAFALLVKQCDFGPRPVGSPAHQKTRDYLMEEMAKYADKTVAQDFTYKELSLTNVIGVFNPEAKRQVLLCAHWDTRPRADQEIDPSKKLQPIIGASDGASGVAVLLELARNFKEQKPDVGVVIVLLDGEDYGSFETNEGVLLGAQYFANHHKGYNLDFGVLLDMVGDKDLDITREVNSQNYAPGTNDKFFRIARELGYGKYLMDRVETNVTDDHIPLNRAGIRTIDIIDFNYGAWHTLDDKPDQCSPESLAMVGNTLAELVYRETAR